MRKKHSLQLLLGFLSISSYCQCPYKIGVATYSFSYINAYSNFSRNHFNQNLENKSAGYYAPQNVEPNYLAMSYPASVIVQLSRCDRFISNKLKRSSHADIGYLFRTDMKLNTKLWSGSYSSNSYEAVYLNYVESRPEFILGAGMKWTTNRNYLDYFLGYSLILLQSHNSTGSYEVITDGYNQTNGTYRFYTKSGRLKMKESTAIRFELHLGCEFILEKNLRFIIEGRPGYGYQFTHGGSSEAKFQLAPGLGVKYLK